MAGMNPDLTRLFPALAGLACQALPLVLSGDIRVSKRAEGEMSVGFAWAHAGRAGNPPGCRPGGF